MIAKYAAKKWHWILTIIVFSIAAIILISGMSGNAITNTYFIPAGTLSIFPVVNSSSEKLVENNVSPQENLRPQEQKLMDAEVLIYEWNVSIPDRYKRNITIIHVSEKDFRDYPELERIMLEIKDQPPFADVNRSLFITGFQANLSNYYHWLLDSICRNKSRIVCYEDLPVFEYHGRYYDIGVAFF